MLRQQDESNNNQNDYHFKQLKEYENEIAWDDLAKAIEPYYLQAYVGRLIVSTGTMLRVYFLQQRYSMTSLVVEEALFKFQVLRKFALIDLDTADVIPNMPCIESFQLLLKEHGLESMVCEAFNLHPTAENAMDE